LGQKRRKKLKKPKTSGQLSGKKVATNNRGGESVMKARTMRVEASRGTLKWRPPPKGENTVALPRKSYEKGGRGGATGGPREGFSLRKNTPERQKKYAGEEMVEETGRTETGGIQVGGEGIIIRDAPKEEKVGSTLGNEISANRLKKTEQSRQPVEGRSSSGKPSKKNVPGRNRRKSREEGAEVERRE